MVEVETVIKNAVPGLGEGPFWEEKTQSLLFVDLTGGIVHRWHSKTNQMEKVSFGTYTGFAIPHSRGGYVAGVGNKILHFQWDAPKDGKVLAEVEKGLPNRLNDAKCDPKGRLFAGSMKIDTNPATLIPGQGNLYRLDADGTISRCREKCTISNGLGWSPDNKTMYFIDSRPGVVYAYDYDVTTGDICNERTIFDMSGEEVGPSGLKPCPDGMTVDTDGNLWVAVFEGSRLINLDPSGKILREIALPARRITSCCFGGENYDELYVTSAMFGLNLEQDPLAGSVFRIKGLGCKGGPAVSYQGV
ncbi:regucalcin-like [Lineus longissimus]|uniref:regucalcin-like n=1 Tax=Lineus longissimus TaxID=88925 RepID=UPI002B4F1BBB